MNPETARRREATDALEMPAESPGPADSDELDWDADAEGAALPMEDVAFARTAIEALRRAFPRVHPHQRATPGGYPSRIGPFELREVIGAGGFALVFRGVDDAGRSVAIKIPRPAALLTPEFQDRFLLEARATSQLRHSAIVTVLEWGEEHETPYIVYEFCDGPTLAAWLSDPAHRLTPRQAAQLIAVLGDAVVVSHQAGIWHRDIKPANVLLFPDGQPADQSFPFQARLTDFGLAKLHDDNNVATRASMLLGTPAYLAPELTNARSRGAAGPEVDVYGLGAVLYELLTGRPPFVAENVWETLLQVRDEEPVPPRLIQPLVPRDLETICLKCLAKHPAERYADAAELTRDLRRFLEGERIRARRPSALRLALRWARQHRTTAMLAISLVVSILLLVAGLLRHVTSLTGLHAQISAQNSQLFSNVSELRAAIDRERKATGLARDRALEALEYRYAADVALAGECWKRNDVRDARRLLNTFQQDAFSTSLNEFAYRYLEHQTGAEGRLLDEGFQIAWTLRLSSDGLHLYSAGDRSRVQVFDLRTESKIDSWETGQGEINGIALDAEAQLVATAGDDGTLKVWDQKTHQLQTTLKLFEGRQAYAVETAGRSQFVAAGGTPHLVFIDASTGSRQETEIPGAADIECLSLSPDRTLVAAGLNDSGVAIVAMETRGIVKLLEGGDSRTNCTAFSPDGRYLAAATHDRQVLVWETESWRRVAELKRPDPVCSLAFSGEQLIAGDRSGTVAVWTIRPTVNAGAPLDLELTDSWLAHDAAVQSIVCDERRDWITSARDRRIQTWRRFAAEVVRQEYLRPPLQPVQNCELLAPGPTKESVWRINGHELELCDVERQTYAVWKTFPAPLISLGVSENSLVVGDVRGSVHVVDTRHPESVETTAVFPGKGIDWVGFSSDDSRLLVGNFDAGLKEIDRETGRTVRHRERCRGFKLSPDRSTLVVISNQRFEVDVLDSLSWTRRALLTSHQGQVEDLAFSSDGRWIATVSNDRTALVWNTTDWSPSQSLKAGVSPLASVAFSPDGRTIATGANDGSVQLWHRPTGRLLLEFDHPGEAVQDLEFTRDGLRLVSARNPGEVGVYSAKSDLSGSGGRQ